MQVPTGEGINTGKKWFAIYTKPRSEKKTYTRLVEQGIEAYVPLVKTLQQWSDRKKIVEKPLISSYLFVKIELLEYQDVLKTDGVVKFVCFEGKAVSIPQLQIDNLKLIVDSDTEVEHTSINYKSGEKIKVILGPMKGLSGELIKIGRKNRVLVRINHINQNLLVNIPSSYLSKEN